MAENSGRETSFTCPEGEEPFGDLLTPLKTISACKLLVLWTVKGSLHRVFRYPLSFASTYEFSNRQLFFSTCVFQEVLPGHTGRAVAGSTRSRENAPALKLLHPTMCQVLRSSLLLHHVRPRDGADVRRNVPQVHRQDRPVLLRPREQLLWRHLLQERSHHRRAGPARQPRDHHPEDVCAGRRDCGPLPLLGRVRVSTVPSHGS
jgi:hypothetical protein